MILRKFLRDESGATAIEYGLIAACISIAIITAATSLGSKLDETFEHISGKLGAPGGGGTGTGTGG